jgi:hypothetical protein
MLPAPVIADASGTWGRESPSYAFAIMGMKTTPIRSPRTKSAHSSSHSGVALSDTANGIVAAAATTNAAPEVKRGPNANTSRSTPNLATSVPTPY